MTHRLLAGIAIVAGLAQGAAQAAPATPEEAQRLTALFQDYVGHPAAGKASAVKVVPHGEAYTASIDLTRLFGFLSGAGLDLVAGDLVAELTPQPDGRWQVAVDGFPPVGMTQGGKASSFTVSNYKFDGTFDPKIQAFATSSSSSLGSQTHVRGQDHPLDIALHDTGSATATAEDAGDGTVNLTSTGRYKDIDYQVTPVAEDDGSDPPAPLAHVKAVSFGTTLRAQHQPLGALLDLWKFLVAHPSKPALVAAQADLKTRLKAVLPVAVEAASDIDLVASKVAVDTGLGPFGLDEFRLQGSANTAESKGTNKTTLTVAGLVMPDGLAPAWSAPLVPTSLTLTQSYGPVNVRPALLKAIDDLDLSADRPLTDEQQEAFVKGLGADDMTLTIDPSSIASATLTLKFQGEARMRKPLPTGAGTISAIGLDRTIEAVRAAAPGDPMGQQVITVLMAAKGFAKAEGPDSYSWRIEAPADGNLTINGNAPSALMPTSRGTPPKTKAHKKPQTP